MSHEELLAKYNPGWQWLGRSLDNYKKMHKRTAESKGVEKQLEAAATLTAARKVLFGYKKRQTK